MEDCLMHVAKKEKFHLPSEAAQDIIQDSNGNLRKALLVLEALKMQSSVTFILHELRSELISPSTVQI